MTSSTPMRIPLEPEKTSDFFKRAVEMIRDSHAHIYFDTSFLMWMTTIGTQSRTELLTWLNTECQGRLHVPVWSAHEYLHHHVSKTIPTALEDKTRKLKKISRLYSELRPFLDEPITVQTPSPTAMRTSARTAFTELLALAKNVSQWTVKYPSHARSVLEFINTYTTDATQMFRYMGTIRDMGAGRYAGRMPPGFQDRLKKGESETGEQRFESIDVASHSLGSNRWGDLLFWKEVLDHAKSVRAKYVVLITNDRKNDWHFGGQEHVTPDLKLHPRRPGLKSVPSPHPLLEYEARVAAGISNVVLLDSPYLGELLRSIPGAAVSSFADVAVVSDLPVEQNDRARRKNMVAQRKKATEETGSDAETGSIIDAPNVTFTAESLRRVLVESRKPCVEQIDQLLVTARSVAGGRPGANNLLLPETLAGLNDRDLVVLARELHDRVLEDHPGYEDVLLDIASALPNLPHKIAGCLFLGFTASSYLDRSTNTPKLPPRSAIASALLSQQATPFAALPLDVLRKRIVREDQWPLYIPTPEKPTLTVVIAVAVDTHLPSQIASLRIADVELLTPAQGTPELTLREMLQGQSATGEQIVRHACEVFMLPFEQLERSDDFDRTFTFLDTAGFKSASTVFIANVEGK